MKITTTKSLALLKCVVESVLFKALRQAGVSLPEAMALDVLDVTKLIEYIKDS